MHKEIDNLQLIYESIGRSYDDVAPSSTGASRRTVRRERKRSVSADIGSPSCPMRVDNLASGRSNSSLILNRHGGSKYAPQESDDHRVSQAKDVGEEENPSLSPSTKYRHTYEMDRAFHALREALKHERGQSYAVPGHVRKQRNDRETERAQNRADYALAYFCDCSMLNGISFPWL